MSKEIKNLVKFGESWVRRVGQGKWKSSGCEENLLRCKRPHESFIAALNCCFAGRITLSELVIFFQNRPSLTLEDCIEENDADTLRIIRTMWLGEYMKFRYQMEQIGRTRKRHDKPTQEMLQAHDDLIWLQNTLGAGSVPVYFSLQEAIGQIEILRDIPAAEW